MRCWPEVSVERNALSIQEPKERATDSIVIEAYNYAPEICPTGACDEWQLTEIDSQGNAVQAEAASAPAASTPASDWQGQLEEQNRASFQLGLARGIEEGRVMEREAQQQSRAEGLEQIACRLSTLAGAFDVERSRYFERVEKEVASLALAIAARILRREAQMDPLLLLGAVRVALGQLSTSTTLRLRVPAGDVELWSSAVALLPHRNLEPQVIADEKLRLGECLLESELGGVDLAVRAQLSEIERSFFDRVPAPPIDEPDLASIS